MSKVGGVTDSVSSEITLDWASLVSVEWVIPLAEGLLTFEGVGVEPDDGERRNCSFLFRAALGVPSALFSKSLMRDVEGLDSVLLAPPKEYVMNLVMI